MSNAPDILDTQSPYWLRLYGQWIHLQGIMPVNDVEPGRAFSELVTVDGYRYEQRAPRGPRTWELPYRYGTAAATAALEAAAYDVALNDAASGRTLLLDTNQAKVNMLPPEIAVPSNLSRVLPPINAGGVWQRSYPRAGESPVTLHDWAIVVRAGITYTAAVWTTAPAGESVLVVYPAPYGSVPPTIATSTGGGTPANPELVTITYTAAVNGEAVVFGDTAAGASDTWSTAGLMFFEGDCPPEHYRHGQRMPVEVSVHDPKITNNLIWRYCDPCKLPREHAVFTINEVGTYPSVGSLD
jgi:hypothetical protein